MAVADSLNDPLLSNQTSVGAPTATAPTTPTATVPTTPTATPTASGPAADSTQRSSTVTEPRQPRERKKSQGEQIAETVQMVKDYARQETLDPVKTAGKWIGFGLLGAVLIGLGTAFLTLGLLRLVQTEWPSTFDGRWTRMLPYLFALVLCVIVAIAAYLRINKKPLTKEQR